MSKEDWIYGLNRIQTRTDLPITLQGGEPTVYKHFYEVITGIEQRIPLDLLTNLEVDIERFTSNIPPTRFKRNAKYSSIRVSYHHGQSNFGELTRRVIELDAKGYSIGVWEVDHPEYHSDVIHRQNIARIKGIDWRVKEFLGPWKGVNYGTMRYDNAVNSNNLRHCLCKTTEMLIAPDGSIFRCHSDVYSNRSPIGHILDSSFSGDVLGNWKSCSVLGKCNSCDIKVKTNRFQEPGHSSVEIKNVSEPYKLNNQVERVENTYGKA